jgi:hypothetical protein
MILRTTLQTIEKHLPAAFDAQQGIRSLFPEPMLRPRYASLLERYVYTRYGEASTSDVHADYWVQADGSGNWFCQMVLTAVDNKRTSVNFSVGFVFAYSDTDVGHGYIQNDFYLFPGEDNPIDALVITVDGWDPWLVAHWPDLFEVSTLYYLSTSTGFLSLEPPPPQHLAPQDTGFASIAVLGDATARQDRSNDPMSWAVYIPNWVTNIIPGWATGGYGGYSG